MFLYNNKLYQHIDSVALDCPLAPTMADIFIRYMYTIILKTQTSDHRKIYVSYINDIFAVFDNDNAYVSFLEVL